jgi:hypothetical protein
VWLVAPLDGAVQLTVTPFVVIRLNVGAPVQPAPS